MSSEKMSTERKDLAKLRAMVVICIMPYSQSEKANWFQVTLAREEASNHTLLFKRYRLP
jgi:hypothetical protein